MIRLTLALLLLGAYTTGNAPWCIYDGYTRNCFYYTIDECERELELRKSTGDTSARCVQRPD